jgi:hypothetical protein
LCRRERLFQHDAVGDALGGPVCGARSAHVNDGKFRVDLSRRADGLPRAT